MQAKSHALIPAGCHTYAKGDDQYPILAPGFIARGEGCHIWDVDGNEYIEYGMGNRCVTLGHAFAPVVEAAREAMELGTNFSRPAQIEVECAEAFLGMVESAEMVKFTKDGSSATTAAVKLARAVTGRDLVGVCVDHPFFASNDWFIATTPLDAGIPQAYKDLTVTFHYNDLESIRTLFETYPDQVACLILEPAKYDDPEDDFLHKAQELCRQHGVIFILDEMITGFRWDNGGAQKLYDIAADLSTFGKGMANGFALSALAGKREIMELGGLSHDKPRVFLLSTTHGAETHAMAAGIATWQVYQQEPVIETLNRQGTRLADGLNQVIALRELGEHVQIFGKPSNLIFTSLDNEHRPSQWFRSLLIQELVRRGVLGPSLVISYSHTDEDIDRTVQAFYGALGVYRRALEDGVQKYLVGRPSNVVYRKYN